jgi:hypothetical protein
MAVIFRNQESSWHGATARDERHNYSYRLLCGIQWEETEHVGAVLSEGHESCQIMSDVWGDRYFALVWDFEENAPRKVTLQIVDWQLGSASCPVRREWDRWHHSATVDATDEVRALYAAWQDAQAEADTLRRFKANLAEAEAEANEVRKGSRVEVFKGRKVPKGTVGECFWVGNGNYGPRCGIRDDDGETHWTALSNVRPLEADWSDSCPDCGGHGWLPANDGKGGTVSCPECQRRYEARQAERKAQEAEREAQEAFGEYVGRGTKVEVVASHRNDAPVGTVGKVFWRGENRYGPGERVGFKDSAGETFWANVENVKVYGSKPAPKGAVAKGSSSYTVPSPTSFAA